MELTATVEPHSAKIEVDCEVHTSCFSLSQGQFYSSNLNVIDSGENSLHKGKSWARKNKWTK